MEGGNMAAVLLQNDGLPCSSLEVLDSLWISNSSPPPPPPFRGTRIVNFDKEENGNNNNIEDSNYDGCYHQPEKKRRLTTDQVQFLERSFEVENKLEPERKAQLAKELGLQPRQVAIWFQNRRARYKTKQLEKEYDCLKASYDKLNADYDCLFKENQKLKSEVQVLVEKLLQREKGKGKSETAEKQLNTSAFSPITITTNNNNNNVTGSTSAAVAVIKQELDAASSAKSDVFDSDSPHCCTDDHNSSNLVLEVDRGSDFSQEEDDDSLSRSLIQPPPPPSSSSCFPKLEDCDELRPNSSCHDLGFPIEEDQAVTWFWPY